MKKLLSIAFVAMLTLSLAACGHGRKGDKHNDKGVKAPAAENTTDSTETSAQDAENVSVGVAVSGETETDTASDDATVDVGVKVSKETETESTEAEKTE